METRTYTLTAEDAAAINKRRADFEEALPNDNGRQAHVGPEHKEGDSQPMIVTRDNGDTVDGQVFLNGNDVLWVTGVAKVVEVAPAPAPAVAPPPAPAPAPTEGSAGFVAPTATVTVTS